MSDKLNEYIRGYETARVYAEVSEPGPSRDRWLGLADAYRVLVQAEETLLRAGRTCATIPADGAQAP